MQQPPLQGKVTTTSYAFITRNTPENILLRGINQQNVIERLTMRQKTLDQANEAWLKRTTAMSAVRRMRDCAARHGLQEASLEEINDIIHEARYGSESTT